MARKIILQAVDSLFYFSEILSCISRNRSTDKQIANMSAWSHQHFSFVSPFFVTQYVTGAEKTFERDLWISGSKVKELSKAEAEALPKSGKVQRHANSHSSLCMHVFFVRSFVFNALLRVDMCS
jgi:hypothetical protein